MANLVFDSPVTLVVKTPNQKVDDLRIDCALEWSVEQLKRHLSRVYPTKPVRFWASSACVLVFFSVTGELLCLIFGWFSSGEPTSATYIFRAASQR